VVAKNSTGTAASATWTFTTAALPPLGNVAPTDVSVSPSSASGTTDTVTLTYADANGFTDIAGAGALINTALDGTNACWFYYDRADGTLWLASDNTASWTALPPGGTVQNRQCAIRSATVTGSGSTFSLTVAITYSATFTGARTIYEFAQDKAGLSTGYQGLGTRH
jgi:hypothetical protein